MSETIEKLEELIEAREALIKGHEGHIATLKDEIEMWQGEIRGVELALKLCRQSEPTAINGTPALIGKYASMGLTESVLDVVNSIGVAPGITARELVTALEAEGFKTKSKDLYNSAYPIAQGLVKQRRISEGQKDGKRTFMRRT